LTGIGYAIDNFDGLLANGLHFNNGGSICVKISRERYVAVAVRAARLLGMI